MKGKIPLFHFNRLLQTLVATNECLQKKSVAAVNLASTLRSWCFGAFIVEYEQNGEDRAEYGKRLLEKLSEPLKERGIKGISVTSLKLCRQFYLIYPGIGQTVSDQFEIPFLQTISETNHKSISPISQTVSDQLILKGLSKTQKKKHYHRLISTLSFSHFVEMIQIDDPLKRFFYEVECINGDWSLRELKRQIGSLLYERTGLSREKNKLIKLANKQSERLSPQNIIRDPYIFEFLGLSQNDVILESDLEDALLNQLQHFILELGKGFCFEARKRRITVDNEYYFVDLVFYHRILKCHILIELKTEKFKHSHVGQLNFYLNYYKKYEMAEGDAPPVGILLCTARDAEHVEFATAGLDNHIFVSKYKLALPTEEELKSFLKKELTKENY